MDSLELLVALLLGAFVWIYPIVRGIRIARAKNYSAAWMWFGVHPVTGWIAFGVLNSLPALKECPRCAEKVKSHAKVCPYCLHEYQDSRAAD